MKIIKITTKENIELLKEFISKLGVAAKTFRYYNTRSVSAIQNHMVTLLMQNDGFSVAYGHLDKENEDIWLGICVLPEYFGKGYGKKMMSILLEEAHTLKLPQIVLTVDKDNTTAIQLYEKMNFFKVDEMESCFKYQYSLQK